MASSSAAGEDPPAEAALPQAPPSPRSPPTYPDVCGKHRLQVGVQSLNREIGFLEEELHSLNDLQPASSCCKGVNDFVGTNPDPLLPINQKRRKCYVWRWLGEKLCIGFSWIICCGCWCKMKRADCCLCKQPKNRCRCSCRTPKNCSCCSSDKHSNCCSCSPSKICSCCARPKCRSCCRSGAHYQCCCRHICKSCWILPRCSCPKYYCGCVLSCSNCAGARLCPSCKPCCISRCLCP